MSSILHEISISLNMCIMELYMPKYLRNPTSEDVVKIQQKHNNVHGFPGMLGSIDCMHWEWKNCLVSWQGQYGRGDKKYPTIMLEAVASQDLWIWHAFYGMTGANNDINVLDNSPVGKFTSNHSRLQLISEAYVLKQRQESARKDVERAFGVLQGRWGLIQQPARAYEVNTLRRIMYAGIIMHNMILEDQNMSVVDLKHVYSNPARLGSVGRYSADVAGGDAAVELTRHYRHAAAAFGDLIFIYDGLRGAQKLQDDCDVQATYIIIHCLPSDVYALVNHQEATKDIWDRVKLLMKGTELSYQERECRLYNLFDKMTMQQVQMNTMFLNALPPKWSKFVTNVKLHKSLYDTNYDQLYAYLSQHERHAEEVRITCERYPDPLALVSNSLTLFNPSQSPQHTGSPVYPPPQKFTLVYAALIHHHQHHTLVQGRKNQCFASNGNRGSATTSKGNSSASQPRVEKLMLAKAQEAGQILDEEQLAFLADPRTDEAPVAQQTIPQT
ncbi:ALP1-like protein [Tanacetum coccineum]